MQKIKKQIMDLKWLLEKSSEVLNLEKLEKMQKTLGEILSDDDYLWKSQNDLDEDTGSDQSAYLSSEADKILQGGIAQPKQSEPMTSTPVKEHQLHPIHSDEKYRDTLKDYANKYLQNNYARRIREAQAHHNPDEAAAGHAYHITNPQHSNDLAAKIESISNSKEFKNLNPREQHRQLAEAQKQHWNENPHHKDEFTASGRERNEYLNAAKRVRGGHIQEEEESIAEGGVIGNDMPNTGSVYDLGDNGDNDKGPQVTFGQTDTAKISGGNKTAAKVFAQEKEARKQEDNKKSLQDMLTHNATNDPNSAHHQERIDRLKGVKPISIEQAQSKVEQVSQQQKEKQQDNPEMAAEIKQLQDSKEFNELGQGDQIRAIDRIKEKHQLQSRNKPKATTSQHVQDMAKEYKGKISSIAAKTLKSAGIPFTQESPEDFNDIGLRGLWEAIRDFNPKVHNFKGLAHRRIKARIKDEINKRIGISKPTQKRIKALEAAGKNLKQQNNSTEEE